MNKKSYNIGLSITDNSVKCIDGIVQFDDGNIFNIQLYNGNGVYDFSQYSLITMSIRMPDNVTYVVSNFGEAIQVLDPANGRLNIQIGGIATQLVGMHYATLEIKDGFGRVTTSRINYNVVESIDTTDDNDLSTMDRENQLVPVLQQLINACAAILDAENLRTLAEASRVSTTDGIIAQARAYAEATQAWYESITDSSTQAPVVDKAVIKPLNSGTFTNKSDYGFRIMTGEAANLPTLQLGELGLCTDTNALYVGTVSGNLRVNKGTYVASTVSPLNTTVLWIDTSDKNTIKFHNGTEWVGTSVATFA